MDTNSGSYCSILNCNDSTIPPSCVNTVLIDCEGFTAPEQSKDVVYRNNRLDPGADPQQVLKAFIAEHYPGGELHESYVYPA